MQTEHPLPPHTIAAVFPRALDADLAVQDLQEEGVDDACISVLTSADATHAEASQPSRSTSAAAAVGFTSGAVGGALAAIGLAAIPGVGWLLGAGPVVGVLASGAATAGTASIGAAIASMVGADEEAVGTLAEAVRRGGTLVLIQDAEQNDSRVVHALKRHRPVSIEQSAERWSQSQADDANGLADQGALERERKALERERVAQAEWNPMQFWM